MTAIIGTITMGLAVLLYISLVFGAPLGEFALGGKDKVLPKKARIVCAFSILIQLFATMILLQTGNVIPLIFSSQVTRILCIVFAIYLSLNVIMNLLSKSKKERFVSGSLSFITAVCFWLTVLMN
jgi:hypothetical protein